MASFLDWFFVSAETRKRWEAERRAKMRWYELMWEDLLQPCFYWGMIAFFVISQLVGMWVVGSTIWEFLKAKAYSG